MKDLVKIKKLLNLTSSPDDAEALSALRMVQKLAGNLGDYLNSDGQGLSQAAEEARQEIRALEKLLEAETQEVQKLKAKLDDQDKSVRKSQRERQNHKRKVQDLEDKIESLEAELSKVQPKTNLSSAEETIQNLEALYEKEVDRSETLKDRLDDKEKALYKAVRDNQKYKREIDTLETKIETLDKSIEELSNELLDRKMRSKESHQHL